MTTGRLAGKVAIVTGGAQGIGGGCARCLAAEGAQVLIVDIDSDTATHNAERIQQAGGAASIMVGDVVEESVAAGMVDRAVEEFGRLDILVQNAFSGGAWMRGTAIEIEPDDWRAGMASLVDALYLGARAAIPAMRTSGAPADLPDSEVGRIVNISSIHGMLQAPERLIYNVGKTAVIGLTRQMAVDFGPEGITVNAIAPGHIVTESMRKVWDEMGNDEGYRLFEMHYPVRRLGTPEDIGAAVTFLCAPEASFITGQTLAVDGGQTVQLQENIVMDVKDFIVAHPRLKTHFDQPNGGVPRL